MEVIKAVEMVREIRDKQFEKTKNMSNDELVLYFHKESELAHKKVSNSKPKKAESMHRKKRCILLAKNKRIKYTYETSKKVCKLQNIIGGIRRLNGLN